MQKSVQKCIKPTQDSIVPTKRSFIPKALRPTVSGSAYKLDAKTKNVSVPEYLKSISIEVINDPQRRREKILWLLRNFNYIKQKELQEPVTFLKECLLKQTS